MIISNLAQLKRVLVKDTEYTVVNHNWTKCIGQKRKVGYADTTGFYSLLPAEPDDKINAANDGKGIYLEWGKASQWKFEDGICSRYNKNQELIIALVVDESPISNTSYTLKDFAEKMVALAKNDTKWLQEAENTPIDYIHETEYLDKITDSQFDIIGEVCYGANEGIYGDIFLKGIYQKNGAEVKLHILTIKTLATNKDAYMGMYKYIGLICYHANEFVSENYYLFE